MANLDEKIHCKICGSVFDDDSKLHRHFRKHGLTVVDYYRAHYPRRDKLTGDFIEFKNKEHYFNSEFNSKSNLITWFSEVASDKEAKDYIVGFLSNRKTKKNLVFSPCQVELRSLMCPSVGTIENYFGNYYKFCETLGFVNKYKKFDSVQLDNTFDTFDVEIDNREQKPFVFRKGIKIKNSTLKFADYKLINKNHFVFFERKSLQDLIGTLSGGYDRFKRELDRAKTDNQYVIIIVETNLQTALKFSDIPFVFKKTKVTPEFIFRNVRDLVTYYPNIQFLFVENRVEATKTMENILRMNGNYKIADLQLLKDKKMI